MIKTMKVMLCPNNKQRTKLFCNAGVAKQAVKDACESYRKFFKGLSKYPKFKSKKKSKPSFYVDTDKIQFTSTNEKTG